MQITSNIKGVIRHLERFEARLDEAAVKMLAPDRLIGPLRNAARLALEGIARPGERAYIPLFVNAVTGELLGPRSALFIAADPFQLDVPDVAGAQEIQARLKTRAYPGGVVRERRVPLAPDLLEEQTLNRVCAGILDWVREEKSLTEEDVAELDESGVAGLYQRIAERIEWIIGVHPAQGPGDRTAAMDEAGERLAARVQKFLGEQKTEMDAETISLWLDTVREVWKEKLAAELPQAVRENLRQLWRSTGEQLL